MDSDLSLKQWFKVKNASLMDLFLIKHVAFGFTRLKLMDWSDVDYCDVLSAVWTLRSDGTQSFF